MTEKQSAEKKLEVSPKKAYQPPSFRFERVFEVSALSCGKIVSTQMSCHQNRKVS
jgi:hypothetical protein